MTLEEKVGQLFVMRVYGHSATAPDQADIDTNLEELGVRTAAELIARYRVGGIIYFTWAHNTRDPHQIAALSNGIQRLPRPAARAARPHLHRPGVRSGGPGGQARDAVPARWRWARADRGRTPCTVGRLGGAELRALGIRQDYSPVADVNVNPANPVIGVRSFGSDPDAVAGLVTAEVKGYQSVGVAATAKHFPGHGTPPSTATSASPSSHTAASCGRPSTPCPSGPPSAPASTRS